MQLMTFNSLLMFDVVFVFFLFLVGVTCLVYYLPPTTRKFSHRHKKNSDLECGFVGGGRTDSDQCASGKSGSFRNGGQFERPDGDEDGEADDQEAEDEENVHYYRQLVAHRQHRCPHHPHHYHHQHQHHLRPHHHQYHHHYDQQLHSHSFMNNRYMPVMSSSPSSSSSASGGGGGFARAYLPLPTTPPPPPPPPATVIDDDDDEDGEGEELRAMGLEEDEGNMEILPPHERGQSVVVVNSSSRHLYHNILNSAFEQHGDPYGDDEDFDMIATNVEILSPSVASISTSLPASPDHHHNHKKGQSMAGDSVEINNERRRQNNHNNNNNNTNALYHLPQHPRLECHSARHVVGICQYHMQQHLKSHHQQHQLHRLYQQQQLLQQFNQQQQQQSLVAPSTSSSSLLSLGSNPLAASIIANPGNQEAGMEVNQQQQQKKVQYMVVDTTADRNKKRHNQYCHVKAHNCDMNRKASSGPVDEV